MSNYFDHLFLVMKAAFINIVRKVHYVSDVIFSSAVWCEVLLLYKLYKLHFIMAALYNKAGHYIFAVWFLSFFLLSFFPCLISAAADWMSTILPHMVWP